jgi:NAD(P)-dependent dehydrogenase (short-subunit alcohol dehydrogenase family)
MTTSSSDSVNASIQPAAIDGQISGNVAAMNARIGVHPKSIAASSRLRSIAASHGRHGVRCNAVAPGMTMTPALKAAFPPHMRKLVEDETLREQLGDPEDIAEAVAFLASDAARNITGQVLVSDGGLSSHVPGFTAFRQAMEH